MSFSLRVGTRRGPAVASAASGAGAGALTVALAAGALGRAGLPLSQPATTHPIASAERRHDDARRIDERYRARMDEGKAGGRG